MKPKVLVTGGSGLLALNWACAMRSTHDIVLATHTRKVKLQGTVATPLSLEDPDTLERALESHAPDIVVHTAGITSVDECERDEAAAQHIYADLSRNVAAASRAAGAALINISTDHLGNGESAFQKEDAVPQPLHAYARAKLAAERAVAAVYPAALIVRTNFFGWGHRHRVSFTDWIYYSLREGTRLTMFDDVFMTTIVADGVAHASHRLLESGASGIYNVAGEERISKYDFAIALAERFGLPKALISRGKIAGSQLSARRPRDMSLDVSKARQRLGTPLGNVAEHLAVLQEQDASGRRAELLAAVTES